MAKIFFFKNFSCMKQKEKDGLSTFKIAQRHLLLQKISYLLVATCSYNKKNGATVFTTVEHENHERFSEVRKILFRTYSRLFAIRYRLKVW
uniref:30S ribosomal protein S15 n=1 Tax=Ascaris lumbricoides TaxID=6252 RepID=A0A0M3I5L8_ASCLU